jgi:peroxiredoxin
MPVAEGQPAPDFTAPDTDRKARSLREFQGKKTVLAFFPGAFTGTCTRELCTFRDSLATFQGMGAQVVAVSVDSPFANKGFAERNNLPFPILSDYNRDIIRQYDLVLNNFAGLPGYAAAKRSVLVLDRSGIVRYRWVSDDPSIEPNYGQVKTALMQIS